MHLLRAAAEHLQILCPLRFEMHATRVCQLGCMANLTAKEITFLAWTSMSLGDGQRNIQMMARVISDSIEFPPSEIEEYLFEITE